MSINGKQLYGAVTEGPLPLFLHAATSHPDQRLRRELWNILDHWLTEMKPRHKVEEVELVLRNFSGSLLEPFVLDRKDLRLAIFLTRLAFTRGGNQTRIRINSSSNPSDLGGLVLTHNLRGYYIERLANAPRTKTPKSLWAFNPGVEPEHEGFPPRLPAEGWIGSHGYEACIDLSHFRAESWQPREVQISNLEQYSSLLGSRRPLYDDGLDFWIQKNKLHLSISRPELMIKLGPKVSSDEGLWVELNQFHANKQKPRIQVWMRFREETPQPVTAQVILGRTDLGGWIHTGCPFSPELPDALREKLEEWLPASGIGCSRQPFRKAE